MHICVLCSKGIFCGIHCYHLQCSISQITFLYQGDSAAPHHLGDALLLEEGSAKIVTAFLQQEGITKMGTPKSADCNHLEHIWNELGCVVSRIDSP